MASSIIPETGYVISFLFSMLIISSLQLANGVVHKVGDSAGWTIVANVDYKQWAISKTFQIGDIIIFEYNPQFHNVMQVTHAEYKACNGSSPISTLTTGNDSITISTHGHHFFICGAPGHCQAGQKVDINVLRAPSLAPTTSDQIPSPVPNVAVPALSHSDAAPSHCIPSRSFGWMTLILATTIYFISHAW